MASLFLLSVNSVLSVVKKITEKFVQPQVFAQFFTTESTKFTERRKKEATVW
jgi:hypothetical protein